MFALVEPSGRVAQLAAQQFQVAAPLVWVDASAHPSIDPTWTCVGGVLAPPAVAAPMVAQQAAAILGGSGGCQIASTSTPALDGTYAVDPESRADIQAEMIAILLNGAFADGAATLSWPDTSGAKRSFTVAEFKAFATALAAYVSALKALAAGGTGSLPAQPVTIA